MTEGDVRYLVVQTVRQTQIYMSCFPYLINTKTFNNSWPHVLDIISPHLFCYRMFVWDFRSVSYDRNRAPNKVPIIRRNHDKLSC